MEFDENLNPVTPPTQPSPWSQPLPYTPPTPPPTITPSPLAIPTTPPPASIFNLPATPQPDLRHPFAPPKPTHPFPMAIFAMMFVITLASIVLALAGDWFGLGQPRHITVSGMGTAYSVPDVAKIDFGVRSTARDLATSQKMNADAIAKIKNDLAPFEISAEDIQTINYNINPDYIYPPSQKPTLSGYTTYHFLRLTMRKLDMVDPILQTLGNSGATDISQIQFTIEDPADVKNEAREKAISAAKDMATQLVTLNNTKLGRVISIQEDTSSTDGNNSRLMDGMGGGGGPGVEQGSLSVTSTVTITYSLR